MSDVIQVGGNSIALLTTGGRWAIFCRDDRNSPWCQVESILGAAEARAFLQDMEDQPDTRMAYVADHSEMDWNGDDVPPETKLKQYGLLEITSNQGG